MSEYPRLSHTVDQAWADKDQYAREQWFADHGDELARKRGAAINATAALAEFIKQSGAHDDLVWSAERYLNGVIDSLDATIAPEVTAWLDSVPAPLKGVA